MTPGPASTSLLVIAALVLATGGAFAWVSRREGEARAMRMATVAGLVGSLPLAVAAILPEPVPAVALGIVAALGIAGGIAGGIAFLLPIGRRVEPNGRPSRRVDERTILFARARLQPDSPEFETYYRQHPEHREPDARCRALPGLLSPRAAKAEPVAFAAAAGSFDLTEALREAVDGPVAPGRVELEPPAATALVKELARRHGARTVGVTRLEPYHLYSHVGRGTGPWGEPVHLAHGWAVAFTVEMDHRVMSQAPEAPVVAESARQYVESARIAVELAATLRGLGHDSRAHIDGNYRVIAPLVAVDAGLGEIGRMGILMTPELGPRVRLGVVTTELELVADPPGDDGTVLDFCRVCRKCAENCPTGAIPAGGREPIDGGRRWRLDADACFRYWNAAGTDCGVCMRVCPYSHPDNPTHDLVRWAIRHSGAARRGALWLDDLFYGRRPPPAAPTRRSAG